MGALTSKPFSFTARSWELSDRITYDYVDTFFSPIKVSFRGNSIIRILPEFFESPLSEWIADRTRFSYDSFLSAAAIKDYFLDAPLEIFSLPWQIFFIKRNYNLSNFSSQYIDLSSALRLKNLNFFLGSAYISSNFYDFRSSFYYNFLEFTNSLNNYKNYFFVGVNLRYQFPVFSVSLRKINLLKQINVFNIGFFTNNLIGDINFGSSQSQVIKFFRFNSRLSRFLSTSSVVFISPLGNLIINKILSSQIKVLSIFDTPSKLSLSEYSFTSTSSQNNYFKFFNPHPFTYTSFNIRYNKFQRFDSLFSNYFYGSDIVYFNKFISYFNITALPFNFSFYSPFEYHNFYTYFFHSNFTKNSLNLLISAKRQVDSRSSFCYYN